MRVSQNPIHLSSLHKVLASHVRETDHLLDEAGNNHTKSDKYRDYPSTMPLAGSNLI